MVKLFGVLLLLVLVSAINAAPTVSNCNHADDGFAVLSNAYAGLPVVSNFVQGVEHDDSTFAAAADFLKAPTEAPTAASSPPYSYSKDLPPVPGTVLMVLSGFLCVSLVKDRKVWLAALTGLLWLSQTGIQLVPQMAQCFNYSNNGEQGHCTKISRLYYRGNSPRLRSDIEGTQYIGLLRYLAGIPHSFVYKYTPVLQAVITFEFGSVNSQNKCLIGKVTPFVNFSPAFIFNNLPRGPPNLN